MKKVLRLYLDSPLSLSGSQPLDFVLRDRRGQVLRRGCAALADLQAQRLSRAIELVLPPGMATVTQVRIPAVSAARRSAVINSAVEPLCLSPLEQVWVGSGARQESGLTEVAWAERVSLQALSQQASQAGLGLSAVLPWSDQHKQERSGQGDHVTLSACSLLMPQMSAQAGQAAVVKLALWGLAAVLAWALVWQHQARSLRQQVRQIQTEMEQSLRQAMPQLPVVVAPLVQARQHRDSLLVAQAAPQSELNQLLTHTAAQWPTLEGRVRAIRFEHGELNVALSADMQLETPGADSVLEILSADAPRQLRVTLAKAGQAGGQP
ncbi:GspL/Epsl periplasmic domain-containing protein [Alcaligenes sp. SDU_A2]|uniref:GspL/Epsl periplasmic domain-containing protein n=1 Tax=Alcaligenes sp. SDU_A2 TaxID=3136634 RepID=UPI00311FA396